MCSRSRISKIARMGRMGRLGRRRSSDSCACLMKPSLELMNRQLAKFAPAKFRPMRKDLSSPELALYVVQYAWSCAAKKSIKLISARCDKRRSRARGSGQSIKVFNDNNRMYIMLSVLARLLEWTPNFGMNWQQRPQRVLVQVKSLIDLATL